MIHKTADETGGELLAWELLLAPGGRVPSSHVHPEQEETFTVVEGQMRFRLGGRRRLAGPGDTIAIPPGTVHSFANPGATQARVLVETRPALDMQALLETAAEMARAQRSARRLLPNPVNLSLFMRDFAREVRAPYLPKPLVDLVTGTVAALARIFGLDASYRRLRVRRDQRASA